MKFLVLLLLTIIAFSNCQDLQVVAKNFEAKIQSLLAAKNFDALSTYINETFYYFIVGDLDGGKDDFIRYLKNGTFTLFNGVGPNDIPQFRLFLHHIHIVSRNLTNGRLLQYGLYPNKEAEFGYLLYDYYDIENINII
ncbi:unnamed protein product [Caenorhabditis angaria]|uniref:DUF38 domain-containing protein n=1 Tax=Caenorhabditis angaria TaxID=860376 RepID=A0A9P1ICX8_9PELO|nr:unnamed protein product [Caenorhabditis angaria]